MSKLVYDVPVDPGTVWEENLYHDVVQVVGGVVETTDPLTIESLQYRGFTLVADADDVPEPEPVVEPPVAETEDAAPSEDAAEVEAEDSSEDDAEAEDAAPESEE